MIKCNNTRPLFTLTIAFISIVMLIPGLTRAGSLEPDAAPAPTMKTLDEVEPRTAIPASSTATTAYTISESGSYYLAGDRLCTSTGIIVSADNVTIDLMGYSLIGPGNTSSNYGVFMNANHNVEIKNGTVRSFQYGIYEGDTSGTGHRVIDIRVTGNSLCGIFMGSTSNIIRGCTVNSNGTSAALPVYGIWAGNGSTVTDNQLYDNAKSCAASAIFILATGKSCIVSNNTAMNNGNNSSGSGSLYVISVERGSTVINNSTSSNGDSSSNSIRGITTGEGCSIVGNSSSYNGDSSTGLNVYGIYAGNGSTVTNNTASYNGLSGSGTATGLGFVGHNLVDQNTAFNNTTNFGTCTSCTLGNNYAP